MGKSAKQAKNRRIKAENSNKKRRERELIEAVKEMKDDVFYEVNNNERPVLGYRANMPGKWWKELCNKIESKNAKSNTNIR